MLNGFTRAVLCRGAAAVATDSSRTHLRPSLEADDVLGSRRVRRLALGGGVWGVWAAAAVPRGLEKRMKSLRSSRENIDEATSCFCRSKICVVIFKRLGPNIKGITCQKLARVTPPAPQF